MAETVAALVSAHRAGTLKPEDTIARTYDRIRRHGDAAMFIHLRDEAEAVAEAHAVARKDAANLPLFGIPVAIKDNIDVAGMPTTAACPDFAYTARGSPAVARLRAAGAIVIGKTNLDQFATGLVGVRSPYGVPRNALRADLIPGGSSSGSAVAVAAGIVDFSLGTDTAGSGRIPAGMNGIVGLKPTPRPRFDAPAWCPPAGPSTPSRSSRCDDDAWPARAQVIAGYDAADPYSRNLPRRRAARSPPDPRIGVPLTGQREVLRRSRVGGGLRRRDRQRSPRSAPRSSELDIEPLHAIARLLYEGPWVAERYLARPVVAGIVPEAMHPVTKDIIVPGDTDQRRGYICGVLQAGGTAPHPRYHLPQHRRVAAADRADGLYGRAGSCRPRATQ